MTDFGQSTMAEWLTSVWRHHHSLLAVVGSDTKCRTVRYYQFPHWPYICWVPLQDFGISTGINCTPVLADLLDAFIWAVFICRPKQKTNTSPVPLLSQSDILMMCCLFKSNKRSRTWNQGHHRFVSFSRIPGHIRITW